MTVEGFRAGLESLLFTGELSNTFDYAGHSFTISTLTAEEMYQVGKVVKPYQGTKSENLAYKVATVSMAIDSVDGEVLAESLTPSDTHNSLAKFNTVSKWYPVVIDKVFSEYIELEVKAKGIVDELGKP